MAFTCNNKCNLNICVTQSDVMSCFLVRYLISTGSDQRPEDEPSASRFSSVRVWIENKVRPVPLIDTKQPYKPGCVIYGFMKRLKRLMVVLVTLLVFLNPSSDERCGTLILMVHSTRQSRPQRVSAADNGAAGSS